MDFKLIKGFIILQFNVSNSLFLIVSGGFFDDLLRNKVNNVNKSYIIANNI